MKNLYLKSINNNLKFLVVAMALLIGNAFTADAQVRVGFTQRTSSYTPTKKIYNVKGDFTMLGNTCLTPQNYGDNTNNNGQFMVYVDADSDPNTFNSSAATLQLSTENGAIPSCSNIIYAGLYWTGKSSGTNPFVATKQYPNTTVSVNTTNTYAHEQEITDTHYVLNISRGGSNNNRTPIYTFSGANTYAFTFANSGTNRITVSVNGGAAVIVPATVNGAGTEATLTTPYSIVDGTATIKIVKLIRNAGTNQSTDDTLANSTAQVNITGITPFLTQSKTYDKRNISLKGPASGAYTQFTAAASDIYYPSGGTDDDIYTAYKEITDYVRTNGIGQYWAADLPLLQGNVTGTGYSGGWGIIVVYENAKMKWRDVTIFDGYAYVNSTNNSAQVLPVSGFNTVQSGSVGVKLGMMASEGDVAFTGDYFQIQKNSDATYLNLSHSGNATDNFFNSSINAGGTRTPSLPNNTGIDICMFNVTNTNNTVIANNQTSTNFRYGTSSDTYSIFAIAMAVDAYIPEVEGILTATTINGSPAVQPYTVLPGQEVGFNVDVRNLGTEAINNYKIVVPVPYNATYVPGSASGTVLFTPLPTPNNVYFDPALGATGSVVWDFGKLPLPASPSTLLAKLSFKFKATTNCQILSNSSCGSAISVAGTASGVGATTGIVFSGTKLIQGYTQNGACVGQPIAQALSVNINGAAYVAANCAGTPLTRTFTYCGSATTVSVAEIASNFPAGSLFYDSFPVTMASIQFTASNPFPLVAGSTVTYYAIPPSGGTSCNYPFNIAKCKVIIANDDAGSPVNGLTGGTSFTNVLVNDTLNGVAVLPAQVITTFVSSTNPGVTLSGTNVVVAPGTAAGSYTLTYQICEAASPANCDTAIVTVTVTAPVIDAVNDTYSGNTCTTAGTIGNVLSNDTLNAVAVALNQVNFTLLTGSNPNITINASGDVIVTAGLAVGSYTFTYRICQVINPGLCDTATVTINVTDTTPPVTPTLTNVTGQCSATAVAPTTTDACAGTITGTTVDPLTYNTQGTFIIHWTFNDGHGNTTTANQTVIVDDTVNPVTPTLANVTGQCSATATPPTTTDLCAGTITGTTTDPLTYNTQGTFIIHWTFNDGNGNSILVNQTVIVDDTTNPVIPTLANVTGQCSATATPPTTTDLCAGTLTGTTNDPLTYNTQGTFTIHWIFNDGNGNSILVNQTVIVDDTTNPVIPTLANVVGQCSATATPPTTTDACAGTITGTTNDPLTYNTQGTFTIHWTFNDGNGNSILVNQTVIVDDTTNPVIPTLANVVGQCSATATPPTTTDACAGTLTGTTNDPLTYTTQGTFTIHWTFNDNNGNSFTVNQTVIVDDTTNPVIPTLANVVGQCSATATPPTTTDACVGTLTGTTNDPLTYTTQGTFTIHWTFNDGNGNSILVNQTVIVDDTTNPVIPTLANVVGQCSATATPPTTTDACAGTLTGTTNDPLTYTTQGTFVIHWTFNDNNGNSFTVNQTVIVDDTTNPVIPQLADVVGQCSATATPPTTTDLCSGTLTGTTTDPLTYTTQGTFIIRWTFNDNNGNTITVNQNVIVDDTTNPVIPQLADIIGQCSATATPPTTTDLCAGTLTGTTTDPLTYTTQGTFVIQWTFNDNNGNTITVNQNVIVDDTTNPVIPQLADIVGQCSATATPPTTTDLCSGTLTATTTDPLTYTTQGTFVIHWTFDDNNGNTITVNQNVIVDDTTNPVIPQLADLIGQCSVTAVPPTTTDLCSGTLTATTNDSLVYNTQGTFVIHWTFNDNNGNTIEVDQNVIVDDTQTPILPQLADLTGQCSVTATPPTTTDNCTGTITATTNDPLVYPNQGTFVIHWTFDDGNGNITQVNQNVIVDNTTPPVLPELLDVVGQCSATAVAPTFTNTCSGAVITATTTDPLTYTTQGTFVIQWTFDDGNGNIQTANQNVIVDDTTNPVIPQLADIVGQCSATATPPTTTDLCSGTLTATTTDPLEYTAQGSYVIHWTFDDNNGNTIVVDQNVIVDDTTNPVIPQLADVVGQCSATATPPTTTDLCSGTLTATTTDPLGYSEQGSYVIHWTFDDNNGNTITVNQNVIVDDTIAPILPVLTDLIGQCSVTAVPPTTPDACAGTITATTNDPLTYTTQGTFVIHWTFDDNNGNTITVNQNVIVDDTEAPVIPQLADLTGQCSVTATPPTTTDTCSGTLTATTTDPLVYTTQGTFVIHWTFDDSNGNTIEVNQNVIVDDTENPVIPQLADLTGQCSVTATPPTTTDTCSGTLTATTTDPLIYTEQGTFVIHWTFDDNNGNTITVNQNVIVDNTTPPVLPELADVIGQCSATAVAPTFTNTCTNLVITATTTDPLIYTEQGSYVIHWTFDDGNGNIQTANQNVIVDDTTNPDVPQLADVVGQCAATATPPSTLDLCSGTLTGTTTDPLTYTEQGSYVIHWTFDDNNGNTITVNQNVIVDDTEAPVIPQLADLTGQCSVTATPPTTTDACSGTLTATTTDPLTYTEQGSYVIHWTFDDNNGNTITVNQNVIVDDTEAPVIPQLADLTGQCSVTATPPTTTDTCSGTLTATTTDPLTYTTQGTFVIHWTFDDNNGNTISVNQNVIVNDTEAPVLIQLADLVGQCSATATPPTTTDNCLGTLTATTADPLTYTEQGTYVIHWIFDDGNGNTTQVNQNVIIDNTTPPVLPELADVVGQCVATAVAPTFTNVCSGTVIIATTTDPLSYTEQGSYVIHWTFDDGNGNVQTANQNVIVDDTTNPEAPQLADVTGQCSATATPPTTTDNCTGAITATTTDPLTYTEQGSYVIHWTFDDGNGNSIVVNQNVIVDDTTNPEAPQLADITGQCSATATPPTTTDNCTAAITATTTDPLTYTEQGSYVIHWTFDDGNGNSIVVNQNVIVDDTTNPDVPQLTDITGLCSATATPPTTTDNCAGTLTATTTDPLSYIVQGSYVIHWTFDDGNGNSIVVNQNVIVSDTQAPIIPTLTDLTGQCSVTALPPSTTDGCAGTITATTTDPLTYSTQGTFVIHWTFSDGNGNTTLVNQNVIVSDTQAPVVQVLPNVTGQCSATVVPPTGLDNCAGVVTGTTTDPLTYTTQGTFIVHWTFSDGNNNMFAINQTVIVDDTIAPDAVTLANVTGQCSVTVPAPTTTDACAGIVTGTTTDPTNYTLAGTYTITWTFDDGNGNTTTATQLATVTPDNAPIEVSRTDADCNDDVDISFDLNTYLPAGTPQGGTWTDVNSTGGLQGSIFKPYNVPVGDYVFSYVVADGDCSKTVNVTMKVDDECQPKDVCTIFVHNAFSPNNSGPNELFIIENIDVPTCFPTNHVEIFNRWGIQVFETDQYDNATRVFRGISEGRATVAKGQELPTGTYFYIINYTDINGVAQKPLQGYLYLTR